MPEGTRARIRSSKGQGELDGLPQDVAQASRTLTFLRWAHAADDISLKPIPVDSIHKQLSGLRGQDIYLEVGDQFRVRCDVDNTPGRLVFAFSDLAPSHFVESEHGYRSPVSEGEGLSNRGFVRLFPEGYVGMIVETNRLSPVRIYDYLRAKATVPLKIPFAGFFRLCMGDPVATIRKAQVISQAKLSLKRTPEMERKLFDERSKKGMLHMAAHLFQADPNVDVIDIVFKIDQRKKTVAGHKSLNPKAMSEDAQEALDHQLDLIQNLVYKLKDENGTSREVKVLEGFFYVPVQLPYDNTATSSVQPLAAFGMIEKMYTKLLPNLNESRVVY